VTARPGSGLGQIESIVTDEIARLAKDGPTAAEVSRAKNKHESEFISGLERIGGFGGKADVLNQYNTFLGDPGKLEADLARTRAVTPEAVRAATDRWLNTRNRAILRFHPEKSTRPADAMTLDRTSQPRLGADRPFVAPPIKTTKLENGLEVLVIERSDLPKVNATLVTRGGAVADPAGKAGVAQLTTTVIDLGTKTRNALQIEEALADLGTSLTGGAGRESARVGLDVLVRNLDPALAIMADVVQNATFPDPEVAREKKRLLDAIAQQDKDANALASRIRPILAFGPEHPYGRPVQGLRGTVEQITRDDLVTFHQARWKPGSSALVLAGDVTIADATQLARRHFGSWSGGAAAAIAIPPPAAAPANKVYLVDRPDAAQTVVTQWLPAPERRSPDYDALKLADAVWGGGGFGTRLNLNLREEKGYSYGVFSSLALMSHAGIWNAAGGVQTNKTKESVVEFDRELKALAGAKPIADAEFATARERRLRGYAQQFESLGRLTQQVADNWILGLPATELQREYDATTKATLAQTLAAAGKYAKPDSATLLLVGDRSKIEAGVRELQLGEIVVLDTEGKPINAASGKASD
jgi:zinc protease